MWKKLFVDLLVQVERVFDAIAFITIGLILVLVVIHVVITLTAH